MEPSLTPPPRFWMRLFRWFCRPEFVEDIEGDLYERYQLRLQRGGRAKAHRRFIKEGSMDKGIERSIRLEGHIPD
ncbi:MAG: permease prefix domain 2-containing transporter [Bacteroidota bacterium]